MFSFLICLFSSVMFVFACIPLFGLTCGYYLSMFWIRFFLIMRFPATLCDRYWFEKYKTNCVKGLKCINKIIFDMVFLVFRIYRQAVLKVKTLDHLWMNRSIRISQQTNQTHSQRRYWLKSRAWAIDVHQNISNYVFIWMIKCQCIELRRINILKC